MPMCPKDLADILIAPINALSYCKLIEKEQEDDIVREDHALPILRLPDQSPSETQSPLVVQRGLRIVEHDARGIVGCAELGEVRGNREAPLLSPR